LPRRPPLARLIAVALLPGAVLLAHWGLGTAVWRLRQDWAAEAAPPPRIQVAFVRALRPSAPPPPARRLATLAGAPAAPAPVAPTPLAAASLPALEALRAPEPPQLVAAEPGAASAADAGEPGPEWPLSTRIDYRLSGYYRGEITGSARVEWLRDGAHYQMHLDFVVGLESAPLMSVQLASDGRLGPDGIEPRRYDETKRLLFAAPYQATLHFEPGRVQLADGHVEPVLAGAQDAASQFVHLTWLCLTGRRTLAPGVAIDVPLVLPRRVYAWRYEVVGAEPLDTRYGRLDTWHLRPARGDAAMQTGDLVAEVWLAPALQYLPVRIRVRQNGGNYADMLIKSAPLQAAAPQSTTTTTRSPP